MKNIKNKPMLFGFAVSIVLLGTLTVIKMSYQKTIDKSDITYDLRDYASMCEFRVKNISNKYVNLNQLGFEVRFSTIEDLPKNTFSKSQKILIEDYNYTYQPARTNNSPLHSLFKLKNTIPPQVTFPYKIKDCMGYAKVSIFDGEKELISLYPRSDELRRFTIKKPAQLKKGHTDFYVELERKESSSIYDDEKRTEVILKFSLQNKKPVFLRKTIFLHEPSPVFNRNSGEIHALMPNLEENIREAESITNSKIKSMHILMGTEETEVNLKALGGNRNEYVY